MVASANIPCQPSEHPLSADAVERGYNWLSWGIGLAAGLFIVTATHLLVPKAGQGAILVWITDWLTNLPANVTDFVKSLRPRTGGFYLALLSVAVLLVRFVVSFVPLRSWLLRYSAWVVIPDLGRLSRQVVSRSEFAPVAGDQFFVERDALLAELLRLSEDARPYGVTVVFGPSGIGKTRLALAWLDALGRRRRTLLRPRRLGWWRVFHPGLWQGRSWEAGFLDANGIAELQKKELSNWQPLRPTAVVLDATELPDDAWRSAEADLQRHAESYQFPVRVLVLSYQPHRFASDLNARSSGEETCIPLAPLGASGVREVYARAAQGRRPTEAETATLVEITGGVPVLVRMMAGEPGWFDTHRPDGSPAVGAVDVLRRYTARIVEACGSIPFGTEPGCAPAPLFVALAVATLAQRMDTSPFDGFSRASLPSHPAIRMEGNALAGVEPPLLALAFLFQVNRDTNAATRATITRRAWREAPEGVASMLRHFWLSVARVRRFAASDDQPGFNDPSWFRPYDGMPGDADSAMKLAWLGTRFDLLRFSSLEVGDRAAMQHDVEEAVADVQAGRASAELAALVVGFWRDQVGVGNLAAWSSLDALHGRMGTSDSAIRAAWLDAVPAAAFHLAAERDDEALALFDRVTGEATVTGVPEAWLAAAWTAVAMSTKGRPDAPGRLCERASDAFRRMTPSLLGRQDFAAAHAGFQANAIGCYGAAQRWGEMAKACRVLDAVAARFPEAADIQLRLAEGAVNAINGFGAAQRWADMAEARRVLDAVAARFPINAEFQLRLAGGAVNAINGFGAAQRWGEMAEAWRVLAGVAARFPEAADIQLSLAIGAINAILHYGAAQCWGEMAEARRVLDAVAARFPEAADIQLRLAEGAINAINIYGAAQRWADMVQARCALGAMAARFPEAADIQVQLAKGAVNAISIYGAAQRWADMVQARCALGAMAARFPEAADIQVQLAKGAVNAILHYGAAQRWGEMAEAWRVLDAVAARFPEAADIQLCLAEGAVNAILHYSAAQRWGEMAEARRVLAGVAARFPEAADIQLRLAEGAFSAINGFGAAQRWGEMAKARRVLAAVAARFPEAADIQLRLAEGAVNAIGCYGAAQRWGEMARTWRVLAGVAARFPEAADIQLRLAEGAVNAINGSGAAQRWADMAEASRVLDAVAARFPEAADIQLRLAQGAVNAINHYGAAQRWGEMAEARRVLDAVAARFPAKVEFQRALALGGAWAINSADVEARRHGRALVAIAARRCPTDGQVQALAQTFGLSFAEQFQGLAVVPLIPTSRT